MPNERTGPQRCPRCKELPDGKHLLKRKWICWRCHLMYGSYLGTGKRNVSKHNRTWRDKGIHSWTTPNGLREQPISLDFETDAEKVARYYRLEVLPFLAIGVWYGYYGTWAYYKERLGALP